MQPNLGLLQSRLVASLLASGLLVFLYLALLGPRFALALELADTSIDLPSFPPLPAPEEEKAHHLGRREVGGALAYEPDFAAFDRSLLGRTAAIAGYTALTEDAGTLLNVVPGTTQYFKFSRSTTVSRGEAGGRLDWRRSEADEKEEPNHIARRDMVEDREAEADGGQQTKAVEQRQTAKTVYLSANTCLQPSVDPTSTTGSSPPQLTLYVSTSPTNEMPGPKADASAQIVVPFTEGGVMHSILSDADVYLSVDAPSSTAVTGVYNVEVGASTEDWYHSYSGDTDQNLLWVDSDYQGALLETHNLTMSTGTSNEQVASSAWSYVLFVQNVNSSTIDGLQYSYCGLQKNALIYSAQDGGKFVEKVRSVVTTTGPGRLPKQQFMLSSLNSSATYVAILAQQANATSRRDRSSNGVVGGGGRVFKATPFTTDEQGTKNCAMLNSTMSFCQDVTYRVPHNPNKDPAFVAQFYDNFARQMYETFEKIIAQIPCEVPPSQSYSLVRNCTSCREAYKSWLCSVSIPRCVPLNNTVASAFTQPRALNYPFPDNTTLDASLRAQWPNTTAYSSSRQPQIDDVIAPGPYREILPCEDLCYSLVQSCPSAMGFGCPTPGSIGFSTSYGQLGTDTDFDGDPTCNYPGSTHLFAGVGTLSSSRRAVAFGTAISVIGSVFF